MGILSENDGDDDDDMVTSDMLRSYASSLLDQTAKSACEGSSVPEWVGSVEAFGRALRVMASERSSVRAVELTETALLHLGEAPSHVLRLLKQLAITVAGGSRTRMQSGKLLGVASVGSDSCLISVDEGQGYLLLRPVVSIGTSHSESAVTRLRLADLDGCNLEGLYCHLHWRTGESACELSFKSITHRDQMVAQLLPVLPATSFTLGHMLCPKGKLMSLSEQYLSTVST